MACRRERTESCRKAYASARKRGEAATVRWSGAGARAPPSAREVGEEGWSRKATQRHSCAPLGESPRSLGGGKAPPRGTVLRRVRARKPEGV